MQQSKPKKMQNHAVYQLKITLRGIEPAIWRTIEVPESIRLDKLHMIFQEAMGWTNSHLHKFIIRDSEYGYPDDDGELDILDETGIKLRDTLKYDTPGFWYLYDFGDYWMHDVQILHVLPAHAEVLYPRCTDGHGTCPVEDCGGVYGYGRMLAILNDPNHEEHDQYLQWVGNRMPGFNITAINKKLSSYGKILRAVPIA